jgi:hypothetical protein
MGSCVFGTLMEVNSSVVGEERIMLKNGIGRMKTSRACAFFSNRKVFLACVACTQPSPLQSSTVFSYHRVFDSGSSLRLSVQGFCVHHTDDHTQDRYLGIELLLTFAHLRSGNLSSAPSTAEV